MNKMKTTNSGSLVWDSSLKKTFRGCESWMVSPGAAQRLVKSASEIQTFLSEKGSLASIASMRLENAGHAYGVRASSFSAHGEVLSLPEPLVQAVEFNALGFRMEAYHTLQPEYHGVPLHFRTSMKIAGSVMLSHWMSAEIGAGYLIDVAHKDQATNPEKWRKDGWGKGTHDAFLIFLFSDVFNIATHYQTAKPLIAEYQTLLDVWRTREEAVYREAMHAAAEFHISRSKDATERNDYEFDDYFHRVYPAELLALQAVRRREGLPEFTTGHLLVDTPWSIIRDLPEVAPHPLLVEVEARMKHDYPDFR